MASSERAEPVWVAHELNTVLLHLAEKLEVPTGPLKSTLKKIAAEWPEHAPQSGCPQDAYLAHCVRQAELAKLFASAIEPILRSGGPTDKRVLLARAVTDEAARDNDWTSLKNDLWALLDRPGLRAEAADEIAARLEVLESERVLSDPAGGGLTALRPAKDGSWPVYFVDASGGRKLADDLIEWLQQRVADL